LRCGDDGRLVLRTDPRLAGFLESLWQAEEEQWRCWRNLTMPTLVIWGEGSPYYDAETTRQMAESPNVSQIVFPDCGHYVPREKPKEFLEALTAFIDRD